MGESESWKRCSTCKKPLAFGERYHVCSVSSCNKKRSGFAFCSVECWEAHVPLMRHRDAGAIEERAPTREAWAAMQARDGEGASETGGVAGASNAPRRRIAVSAPAPETAAPKEILVVVSKLKAYIRQRYGMNTSDAVVEVLSDALRQLADEAVGRARAEGRKTVLDRDFEAPSKS